MPLGTLQEYPHVIFYLLKGDFNTIKGLLSMKGHSREPNTALPRSIAEFICVVPKNWNPILVPLNIRCRNIVYTQTGP